MATRVDMGPDWVHRINNISDEALGQVGGAIVDDAGRFAPTGARRLLKHSFGMVKPRPLVRWIGSSLFYMILVEKGTGRHTIRGNPVLRWPGMRVGHPVRSVNHPGGTARVHLRRALYQKRRVPYVGSR